MTARVTARRGPELRTERLILRRWHDADRDPFAAINADPVVMEKIGMRRDPADDFDPPNTPGWHGQRHVLYRLSAAEWSQYRLPS